MVKNLPADKTSLTSNWLIFDMIVIMPSKSNQLKPKQPVKSKSKRSNTKSRRLGWYMIAVIIVFSILIIIQLAGKNNPFGHNWHHSYSDTQKDIAYCDSTNPAQKLDLYRTAGNKDKLPLLVYIHGGGWRSGSKNNKIIKAWLPFFLQRGVAVASVDYRLNPSNPYPDQNNDIACALTFLNDRANQYGLDIEKSIFFGDSSGGQLAAFAALNIPYRDYDYEAPVGVIDFYGVSNFSKIIEGSKPDYNARRYLGSKYNRAAVPASPTTYITKQAPRFLIIHGSSDRVVPISQSKLLYDDLTRAGIDAEYVTVPSANHGFAGPELTKQHYQSLKDNVASFLRETIGR